MSDETTVVHLMRHGEVYNPHGVLYGRLPGYQLSDLGRKMADRVAEHFSAADVAHVVASPLERAQETATPIAEAHDLEVAADRRLIEASNIFEGKTFGIGDGSLRRPEYWRYLVNPFRPSWGEPYVDMVVRMNLAIQSAREAARGREAVCVSHQLPIWVTRCHAERRRLWHDPRRRQCSLASVTSLTFEGDRLISVGYREPARDLLPARLAGVSRGGANNGAQAKSFGA